MEANELRVGNYVNVFGIPQLVDGSMIVKMVQIEIAEKICIDVTPIELTEELLLKCGFNLITDDGGVVGKYTYWSNDFIELNNLGYWFVVSTDFNHPKINYLHQLQNLYFALTQTELQIKL